MAIILFMGAVSEAHLNPALFWIPIVPFWALFIMLLDVLVIYTLAVYGGERREA